jgi:hypothetical protein
MPIVLTMMRLTTPDSRTPSSAIAFALRPAALVRPRKNCFPY